MSTQPTQPTQTRIKLGPKNEEGGAFKTQLEMRAARFADIKSTANVSDSKLAERAARFADVKKDEPINKGTIRNMPSNGEDDSKLAQRRARFAGVKTDSPAVNVTSSKGGEVSKLAERAARFADVKTHPVKKHK